MVELNLETSIVKDTKEDIIAYLRKLADKIERGEDYGMLDTYLQGYWWSVTEYEALSDE